MSDLITEIEYLANLSRLNLTDQEKRRMSKELSDILNAAEKIKELDTSEVEATSHVSFQLHLRKDQVTESLPLKEVSQNASCFHDAQFEVPPIKAVEEE